jgi:ring-opening amidohydrolase-like protein
MRAPLLPEDIGRPAMVEKVADGVRAAMRDAGIGDPADVHYVQTKTPLLTIDAVRDAESRGQHVACEVHDSMGVSNGTTALGIAVALGEIAMPRAEQICKELDLYSSVASCSSGVELTQAQIVLLGNKAGAGGRYRIGHAVMKDAIDIDGIYDAIRNAGLSLRGRPARFAARTPADHARRFRRAPSSPLQGCGRRRRRRRDRRSCGVRLRRRHASGPARRRAGHRHRGFRRIGKAVARPGTAGP